MATRKLLVTGHHGLVGCRLVQRAGTDWEVVGLSRHSGIDITDAQQVERAVAEHIEKSTVESRDNIIEFKRRIKTMSSAKAGARADAELAARSPSVESVKRTSTYKHPSSIKEIVE